MKSQWESIASVRVRRYVCVGDGEVSAFHEWCRCRACCERPTAWSRVLLLDCLCAIPAMSVHCMRSSLMRLDGQGRYLTGLGGLVSIYLVYTAY